MDFLHCVHVEFLFKELEETREVLESSVVDLVSLLKQNDTRHFLQRLHRFEFFLFVHVEHSDSGLNINTQLDNMFNEYLLQTQIPDPSNTTLKILNKPPLYYKVT